MLREKKLNFYAFIFYLISCYNFEQQNLVKWLERLQMPYLYSIGLH